MPACYDVCSLFLGGVGYFFVTLSYAGKCDAVVYIEAGILVLVPVDPFGSVAPGAKYGYEAGQRGIERQDVVPH